MLKPSTMRRVVHAPDKPLSLVNDDVPKVGDHEILIRVEAAGVFRYDMVQRLIREHIHEEKYEMHALWTVLIFMLWHAIFIEGSVTPQISEPVYPVEL